MTGGIARSVNPITGSNANSTVGREEEEQRCRCGYVAEDENRPTADMVAQPAAGEGAGDPGSLDDRKRRSR